MAWNDYLSVLTTGLDANLPLAANLDLPALPRWYWATDTNILYKWNNVSKAWDSTLPKPVAVGAASTARAIANVTYLLDTAAGSVLTLPAATGSGLIINIAVSKTTTSNAHKVLTSPITDKIIGSATGATVTTKAALLFSAAVAGAFHSLQMPFTGSQPSGGFEGDVIQLTDLAAGVWLAEIMFQSGTTPTTPFSTATT